MCSAILHHLASKFAFGDLGRSETVLTAHPAFSWPMRAWRSRTCVLQFCIILHWSLLLCQCPSLSSKIPSTTTAVLMTYDHKLRVAPVCLGEWLRPCWVGLCCSTNECQPYSHVGQCRLWMGWDGIPCGDPRHKYSQMVVLRSSVRWQEATEWDMWFFFWEIMVIRKIQHTSRIL